MIATVTAPTTQESVGEVWRITPQVAADMLDMYNKTNRPLSNRVVAKLATSMSRGEWKWTGIPIILYRAPDGSQYVQDGQHRLWAIVESGVTLEQVVCIVDELVYDVLGEQKGRSLRDTLALDSFWSTMPHVQIANSFVSALNIIHDGGVVAYNARQQRERIAVANEMRHLVPFMLDVYRMWSLGVKDARRSRGEIALYAGMGWCKEYTKHPDAFNAFVSMFCSGAEIPVGSPILRVRPMFAEMRTAARSETTIHRGINAIARCWNAYYESRGLTNLYLNTEIPPIR